MPYALLWKDEWLYGYANRESDRYKKNQNSKNLKKGKTYSKIQE